MNKILNAIMVIFMILSGQLFAGDQHVVVLVHGAHGTEGIYRPLQNELDTLDIPSVAISLPGRNNDGISALDVTLEKSADAFCEEIGKIQGRKTVVVFSQAGAIALHAAKKCFDQLTQVIFLSALVPQSGQTAFHKLSHEDEINYFSSMRENKEIGVFEIADNEKFLATFAPGANESQRTFILENSVPEPVAIGNDEVTYDKDEFGELDLIYIKTLQDKIISLETQEAFIKNLEFIKVLEIDAGHLSMVTHPVELAEKIKSTLIW